MMAPTKSQSFLLVGVRALSSVAYHTGIQLVIIFLAHLSQRLIGELIVYPLSGGRPSSVGVRRHSHYSNIFSGTAKPIKAKFYVEPPLLGGMKVCSRHLGYMTMPIYGKNPSKIFSGTSGLISTKLSM